MAKNESKYEKLTPAEYDRIKLLQNAGINCTQASKIVGRAGSTTSRIYSSDSYEDYKSTLRETNRKSQENRKKRLLAKKQAQSNQEADQEVKTATVMNLSTVTSENYDDKHNWEVDQLERIAVALERLANAWEAQPKKKLFR